jgi:5'-nucleotidase
VKKVEKQNPNTIVVGAGDLINGKGAGSSKKTVRALDRIGLAASALGNHEFDNGVDAIDELKAGFPYLSVNAVDSTGRRVFDAYRIVNVGGVAVGFIGATTRDTKPVDGVRFTGIVRAVNAVASQLTDGRKGNGEADVVILLVHEGAATSSISTARDGSEFGTITRKVTSKVDAIVGAHSHRSYAHRIAAPDGHKRPVVSAGVYGSHYGRLIFEVSAGGKVTATGGVHNLIGAAKPDAAIARIVD